MCAVLFEAEPVTGPIKDDKDFGFLIPLCYVRNDRWRSDTFGMTGVEVAKSRDVGERLVWGAARGGSFGVCVLLGVGVRGVGGGIGSGC